MLTIPLGFLALVAFGVLFLLGVLHRLVDKGNTVLVIEHNLDVIKTADWILDLGPEGGGRGGQVVAQGPPERVARTEGSYTGQVLAEPLGLEPAADRPGSPGRRRNRGRAHGASVVASGRFF